MIIIKRLAAVTLALMAALTVGCSQASTAPEASSEDLSLKIGVMPAVDSDPIF